MTPTLDSLTDSARQEAAELGLQNPFETLPSAVGFAAWFDRIEENFRLISVSECRTIFNRYQGAEVGDLDRFRELNAYYCFDEMIERHCRANVDDLSGRLHRRVTIFLEQILQFKVAGDPQTAETQTPLETRFMKFRGTVAGEAKTMGQLNQLIKRAPSADERREAWASFIPLGVENAADFRHLAVTRNRLAQTLGYRDFIDMKWRVSGIDEAWLLGVLDKLEAETAAPYEVAVRDMCQAQGLEHMMPWDIAYAVDMISPLPPETFDEEGAARRLKAMLAGWGFDPTNGIDVPVTICDSFSMGGLCFGIEPGKEVAILLAPTNGPRFYRTFFHEFGHAMHFRYAGQGSILLNVEDMAFNEGMAVFFESFVSDPDWVLANFPELSPADREQYIKHARYAALVWMRTLLANVRFEHALYTQPELDLNAYWLEIQRRCGGYDLPADMAPRWAADQMLVSLPCNWHNYVIAELIAKQTREALVQRDGALLDNPKIRDFLFDEYYTPGASVPWIDKVAKATGKPLSADAFFRAFQELTQAN